MPSGVYIRTDKCTSLFKKGHTRGMLGKKHSSETISKMSLATKKRPSDWREKLSEAKKGKPRHWKSPGDFKSGQTPWNKGLNGVMVAWNKGKPFSMESREKMRDAHLGKRMGELNHSWKGGVTPEHKTLRKGLEYRAWRESVFIRDNWTCLKCHKRGGKIVAHHILNFASYVEGRFDINNGVVLCSDDHNLFHKRYGKKDNSAQQLEEFLNE